MVGGGAAVAGANDRTSAELYDPGTGTWTSTGSMLAPRAGFSATLLADGKVLVAGGAGTGAVASAELYDPVSGTWSRDRVHGGAFRMSYGRAAARWQGARGGMLGDYGEPAPAELYDPISGTWTATGNMVSGAAGASGHVAARRQGARVGRSPTVVPSCTTRSAGPGLPPGT